MDVIDNIKHASSWRARSAPGISFPCTQNEYPSFAAKICQKCQFVQSLEYLASNLEVCSECDFHYPMEVSKRISLLLNEIYHEIGEQHRGRDFLGFHDTQPYLARLQSAVKKTQRSEALSVYSGKLQDHRIVLATFNFDFIGGSMSSAVGQRFVDAVTYSIEHRFPLVCQALSGGARMQEGLHSLVQMTRTSAAIAKLSEEKIPYIVTLCSPCMGGVSASLASLGDVTLAEPNALIGFAGPRVIAQTVGAILPEGFQTSDFVQKCGFIDQIVSRKDLKSTIARWLRRLTYRAAV